MRYDKDPKQKPDSELNEEKDEEEKFSFLRETIKKARKKKIFPGILKAGVMGFVFGIFACLGFFALNQWAFKTKPEAPLTLIFPEDENAKKGNTEEEPQKEASSQEETEKEDSAKENQGGDVEDEKTEQDPANQEVSIPKLNAENLKELYGSLYEIVKEADKSMAYVSPVIPEGEEPGDEQSSAAGILLADNGPEFLILCRNSVCRGAEAWTARLADNKDYEALLKKQDMNTGLAIFSVDKAQLDSSEADAVKIAELGNSNFVARGELTFSLGNIFGHEESMEYGIINSNRYQKILSDRHYNILPVDMPADKNSTGFLFNLKGEVIGLIHQDVIDTSMTSAAGVIAVSDLKKIIELMANGEGVPYAGVCGVTITEAISEAEEMPRGVYVNSVQTDSPAMEAGIQSGDILQEIGGTSVFGVPAYEKIILESKIGENIVIHGKRRGASGYVDIEFTMTTGSRE